MLWPPSIVMALAVVRSLMSSVWSGAIHAKSTPSENPAAMIVFSTVVDAPWSVSNAPRTFPDRVSLISVSAAPPLSIPPPRLDAPPLSATVVLVNDTVPPYR